MPTDSTEDKGDHSSLEGDSDTEEQSIVAGMYLCDYSSCTIVRGVRKLIEEQGVCTCMQNYLCV
jgi:hypothetical protein